MSDINPRFIRRIKARNAKGSPSGYVTLEITIHRRPETYVLTRDDALNLADQLDDILGVTD